MPFVKKISINLKIGLILFFLFFAKAVLAQTMSMPGYSSTGTFTITLSNIYSWAIQEKVGSIWTSPYSGTVFSYSPITVTKPEGTYSYRLYNCFPQSNGCSYSVIKTIVVDFPDPTPSPPTLNVPTTDADGSYSISWSDPQYTHGFYVEERLNSGEWSRFFTGANSRDYSGKGNGTWSYRVRACNNIGDCSGYSSIKSVMVAHAPGTPASITTPGTNDGNYTVSWGAASGSVSYYDFEYRINSGSWTDVYSGSARSKTFSNLGAATYTHRVRACKTVSSYTNCSGYRTSGNTVVAAPSSTPTVSLPATDADGSYSVSWGAISNTNNYQLQEQVNGGSWTAIQDSSATSRTLSRASNTYAYRVRACNAIGCSHYSAVQTIYVALAPGIPSTISVTQPQNGTYTVNWGEATGSVSFYDMDFKIDSGSWTNAYDGTSTSTERSITEGGDYLHRVRACKTVGTYRNCSGFLNSPPMLMVGPANISYTYDALGRLIQTHKNGSIKTSYCYDKAGNRLLVSQGGTEGDPCADYERPLLPAPGSLSATTHSGGGYRISWGTVDGATTYTLKLTNGATHYINDPYQTTFYTGSMNEAPDWIRACNWLCGPKAYF